MTAPPVAALRSRPGTVQIGTPGEPTISIRSEVPEVWDVIRIEAPATTPVAAVKHRALEELVGEFGNPNEWVVKLGGFEVLDENVSLTDAGVRNGSTLLITSRRRRPVR